MADSVWASIKPDWHEQALCDGVDTDRYFYPNDENDPAALALVQNKFCNLCPVRGKCLNSAIINKDWGLWAGTTRRERQAMARNQSRAKCPLCSANDLVGVEPYEVCVRCGASWKATNRPAVRPEPGHPHLTRDFPRAETGTS